MYYPGDSGMGYQTYPYEDDPYHPPQQPYAGNYLDTHRYQTLRPPSINTGFPSSGHPMNRTSSYSSSDSGYVTRPSSVASPIPQQIYPAQSYPYPAYPDNSYGSGHQLSQYSAAYSYNNQRSPSIEVVHAAPVSSSKHKKERRLSTPSPSSPSEYACLHPNCGHISSRAHDLKRHMTVHFPPAPEDLLDCKYEWCGRTGAHGFKREDHRKEHYRKVHMKSDEYPKTGKGGRHSRRS